MAAAGESGIVGEEVSSAPEMSSLQPCTLGNLKYLPFIRFPPHMRVVKAGTVEEAMRVVMVSFKMNKTPNSRSHLVNSGKRLNNPSVCERPLPQR